MFGVRVKTLKHNHNITHKKNRCQSTINSGATRYVYDNTSNLVEKITANHAINEEFIEYVYDHSRLTNIKKVETRICVISKR